MPHINCSRAPSWGTLTQYAKTQPVLERLFEQDSQRFSKFSYSAPYLFADLSKQHITKEISSALITLAHECNLEGKRDAMFAGAPINTTENRQALHTALRGKAASPFHEEIESVRKQFLDYADLIRSSSKITDIVNIGIGGSDLGPKLGVQALAPYATKDKRFHFVSNVDGLELANVLKQLNPKTTLFIVVSKSFSTQETLLNAQMAKTWLNGLGYTNIAEHFVGITTNIEAARQFGIEKTFAFWDWVGGRYSVWSAVGLTLAIAIGSENFLAFLDGAHQMDEHFKQTPLEKNLPALLGLVDVWNRNFLNRPSRCIAPYSQSLAELPLYLQQLEMESNGKGVDQTGKHLDYNTSPIIWGEVGSNCQHTFFQMLHQGTDTIPVEFILVKQPTLPSNELDTKVCAQIKKQHRILLTNALAQGRALMAGQESNEPTQHCYFPGNRPSSSIILEKLDPTSLGALIALHEHRVFTSGAIWNINSFDQWGVELGKNITNNLLNQKLSQQLEMDSSTNGLLKYLEP